LLQLVQRIILLEKGKVVADGPRDTVLQKIMRPKAA
jgi:ATP-binding cassette subfamily C protein LapB